MESICEWENTLNALKCVERNKGAPGIDKMKVTQLRGFLRRTWKTVKAALLNGTYKPLPVRRKEIPKPDGGIRLLGISTVQDRFVQQCIAQVLQAILEHTFSAFSFGNRPRRCHDARQHTQGRMAHQSDTNIKLRFTSILVCSQERPATPRMINSLEQPNRR